MLTTSEEATLIAAAQAGDNGAAEQLINEYRPNLAAEAQRKYPGDAERDLRDEYSAELTAALWQAIQDFDPETDTRLQGAMRTIRGAATAAIDSQALPLSAPAHMVKWFRQARRVSENLQNGEPCDAQIPDPNDPTGEARIRCGAYVADAFSAIKHALAHVEMSLTTYTELLALTDSPTYQDADEGHKNRFGETVGAYVERTPEQSVAQAETALNSMTGLQYFLAVHKYGFDRDPETWQYVTLPRQYENIGRPNSMVADYYNATPIDDKPLTQTGSDVIGERTVDREISAALANAHTELHPEPEPRCIRCCARGGVA